jgi:ribosome-associated heat shock protein Hsp15
MDKWLWAVRLFKSRSLAAAACTGGKVKINGQPVKPARPVRVGETISAVAGEVTRTVQVLALLDRRVGAKLVGHFLQDLTPSEEFAKPRERALTTPGFRPAGLGRPTKRERRLMERWWAPPPSAGQDAAPI